MLNKETVFYQRFFFSRILTSFIAFIYTYRIILQTEEVLLDHINIYKSKKQKTLVNMWSPGDEVTVVDLTGSPPKNERKRQRQNSDVQVVSSKKQTQWVSSAFGDFGDFGGDFTTTQKSSNSSKTKSHKECTSSSLKHAKQICREAGIDRSLVSGSEKTHTKKKRPMTEMELWSDKYSPKCQADLAVHKKKISEVETWLQVHLKARNKLPPIALLTGPAGVGKTATIKVIAKELKCEIQEWINPTTTEYDTEFRTRNLSDFSKVEGFTSESQLGQFQNFLLRANKYNSLGIFGDDVSSRKLILVEDFPNIFFRDASLFHDILRKYCKFGRCPLVFIVSDSTSGESNERLLFPKDLQQQLHIENISFNPVALTSMTKVLTKLAQVESSQGVHKFPIPSRNVLESIAMSSAGDIRGAINALQFACLKDTEDLSWGSYSERKPLKKSSSKEKFKGKMKKEHSNESSADPDSELAAIGGRDTSLFLFRALGKILYCKRDDPRSHSDLPSLPSHLAEHNRDPLLINPEEVVEKSHLSGDYFSAYLHQNYVEFYTDIEDLVRASEYLSDSDNLTVEWTYRSVLQEYAAAVATRGIIHANTSRSRHNTGGSGLGWKPLHKPQWYSVNKQARQNCESARFLFKNYAWSPEVLQTEVLPYISLINATLHNPGQISFLQDICRFSNLKFPSRSEKLDEKDVIESESLDKDQQNVLKLDLAGDSKETDDVITNSQSKVKTAEEDEEFEIEEFDY